MRRTEQDRQGKEEGRGGKWRGKGREGQKRTGKERDGERKGEERKVRDKPKGRREMREDEAEGKKGRKRGISRKRE